ERRLGGGCANRGPLTRACEGRTDEVAEQRRRTRRPRLELWMELARHEPGVVGQLDDLDQPALLERARNDQPAVHERGTVMVVDVVTMPVTLVHDGIAAGVVCASPVRQHHRMRTEP